MSSRSSLAPKDVAAPLASVHERENPTSLGSLQFVLPDARWRRVLGIGGPGVFLAVGYVDPGNWATDLGGGSKFGYALLSIVLIANIIAMAVQALCARMAIVTGKNLAQLCRDNYPRSLCYFLWLGAEIAIIATDLAELVGGAVALKLLFGIALLPGILLLSLTTLLLLALHSNDWRWLRGLVCSLLLIIGGSFVILLWLARPDWFQAAQGLVPTSALLTDATMLVFSIGILGATVMPHNLYLHTGLLAPLGIAARRDEGLTAAIRHNVRNSTVSLTLAFFINASILIAAAAIFHKNGMTDIEDLGDAYQLLNPVLGSTVASTLFAVGLLAAGQSSTITGTLAGQIVMEGFLQIRMNPFLRRLVTRLLALGPILVYFSIAGETDTTWLLVLSQVVLSLQLPFAVIPLLWFVSSRRLLGEHALSGVPWVLGWFLAFFVVLLNAALLVKLAF